MSDEKEAGCQGGGTLSLKEDLSMKDPSLEDLSLNKLSLNKLSLSDLSLLASSPHGRLEARRQGGLATVLKELEAAGDQEEQVSACLAIISLLCLDCDCALELAQRGLHTALTRLLRSSRDKPELQDLTYAAIQAASESLPVGHSFPMPQSLPDSHPPLPHIFTLPQLTGVDVSVVARSETSLRLHSQQDVGQLLWPAALVMGRWMLRTAPTWLPASQPPQQCSLLELGAGIGLTGLAAATVVGSVTLTDFNTTVLANLRYNATLLRDRSEAARVSGATLLAEGHSVQVQALDWYNLEENATKYNVIIGSDIVCSDADGEAAAGAVAAHLHPQGLGYFLLPPPFVRFGVAAFTTSLVTRGMLVSSETVSSEDVPVRDPSQEEAAVGGGYENTLVLHTVSWPRE